MWWRLPLGFHVTLAWIWSLSSIFGNATIMPVDREKLGARRQRALDTTRR
jgi:hypothetical protein